jgi:prefoldin subunit 5
MSDNNEDVMFMVEMLHKGLNNLNDEVSELTKRLNTIETMIHKIRAIANENNG